MQQDCAHPSPLDLRLRRADPATRERDLVPHRLVVLRVRPPHDGRRVPDHDLHRRRGARRPVHVERLAAVLAGVLVGNLKK